MPYGMKHIVLVALATLGIVQAPRSGNPILPGWYADPEARIFEGQYWIYPTYSAPYDEQTFLDAFSSTDLVTWTKHPRIARHDEHRLGETRGVGAVDRREGRCVLSLLRRERHPERRADSAASAWLARAIPAGRSRITSGKPLVDKFHNGAQPIDPFVFKDQRRHVLPDLRRLASLQHREAERGLHGLRAVRRRHDVQGDHAGRLRRGLVHVREGREVLLHVVRRRLDRPELRGRLRDRHVTARARSSGRARSSSRIRRSRPAPAITRCFTRPARATGTSSTTAARSARPIATTASCASTRCTSTRAARSCRSRSRRTASFAIRSQRTSASYLSRYSLRPRAT